MIVYKRIRMPTMTSLARDMSVLGIQKRTPQKFILIYFFKIFHFYGQISKKIQSSEPFVSEIVSHPCFLFIT